jgi:hypothetical protein
MGYWIYNPVFNNWYYRFNAVDTPEPMDWEPTPSAPPALSKRKRSFDDLDLHMSARRRLDFDTV